MGCGLSLRAEVGRRMYEHDEFAAARLVIKARFKKRHNSISNETTRNSSGIGENRKSDIRERNLEKENQDQMEKGKGEEKGRRGLAVREEVWREL